MKMFKKICAFLLAIACICLCFAGCHKQDEIAVTIKCGDEKVEFTSAMYAYALLEADMAARNKIDSEKSDSSAKVNYHKRKIDGVKFVDYVEAEAIKTLRKLAYYQIAAKELGVKLTDEEKSESEYYAYMYWYNYGYATTYEPNGIGYQTFVKVNELYKLADSVFTAIYGEGGEKAVDSETLNKKMYENYELADIIAVDISEKKEDEIKTLKSKFEAYADRLNKGEAFETIYNEYYEVKESDKDTHEHTEEDDDTLKPLDEYATLIGSKDTDNADAAFSTIKRMEAGKAYVDTASNEDAIRLVLRGDLSKDEYYIDLASKATLWMLKESEYETLAKDTADEYEVQEHKYAISQFKVKNMYYPTAQ